MSKPVHGTYSSAQNGTVLVSSPQWPTRIKAVLFACSAANTNTPAISVSHGGTIAVRHPGVSAGGGLTFSGLDCGPLRGDITVSCDDPGGTCDVTVIYESA